MEAEKQTQPPIIDQLKDYAETRIKLVKYQAIESGSSIAASVIADVIAVVCMVFAFVFASFTLAFYLSQVLKSYWAGFGCVALLYVLIAVLALANKKAIQKPIITAIISKFF